MSELKHYGVPGMKWGVRKKSYNKDQMAAYRYALRQQGYDRGSAKSVAKNAQKRMIKKGESHSMALQKAQTNRELKNLAAIVGTAGVVVALANPKVRKLANEGAWILGKKTGQAAGAIKSAGVDLSKFFDRNLINVDPIDASRGREVVGLLLKKN